MTEASFVQILWINNSFRAKIHKSSTVVFSTCASSFARSQPGIFLINWPLIWTERASWAKRIISTLRAVSSSNRVCSAAASVACASIGATAGGLGTGETFIALVCKFTEKFSGCSVFDSNLRFSSFRICSSCNGGLQKRSRNTVTESSNLLRAPRGHLWKQRKAAPRRFNCKKFRWLAGSAATGKILRRRISDLRTFCIQRDKGLSVSWDWAITIELSSGKIVNELKI